MEPFHEKTLALLIQLPPSLEKIPGLEGLKNLLPLLDDRFRYAVEVRHLSWFQDLATISLPTIIFARYGVNLPELELLQSLHQISFMSDSLAIEV